MSHSASLQTLASCCTFLFLLRRWEFWWRCVSIWILYKPGVTLRY